MTRLNAPFCLPLAIIRASFVIRHLDFVISFAWLSTGNFAIAGVDFQNAKVRRKKYASPHLVYLRRLPRGMRGQGAYAYASIDHLDSRARYCRLDHRRRRNPPVLSAKCRRQISSGRINCFNRWGDSNFVRLAQVQTAAPSRIESARPRRLSAIRYLFSAKCAVPCQSGASPQESQLLRKQGLKGVSMEEMNRAFSANVLGKP